MISLQDYIYENENINEGFLFNALTKRTVKNMNPKDLFTGILNMYDYIVDEDDIKLFLKDFPLKERAFWANLYNLYKNQVWSIFDVSINDIDSFSKLISEFNKIVNITPEFRRELRQLIKQSKNEKLDLKPSIPSDIMAVKDDLTKSIYVFTINRATGIKGVFRPIDKKFLTEIFNKLGTI